MGPTITELVVEGDVEKELLPLLLGRVFHVTRRSTLPHILACGQITPRSTTSPTGPFGNYKSACAELGCISVFDVRSPSPDGLKCGLSACAPWHGISHDDGRAVLFIAERLWDKLIPWTALRDGENTRPLMWVPYLEAGYPGRIGLEDIDGILGVAVPERVVDLSTPGGLHLHAALAAKQKRRDVK